MASYHCTIKVGLKGKGASASAHAAYILREGKYALKEDVVAVGSMNMPAWAAHDPQIFWQASDDHERERGSTYREFELALPRELTPAQRVALVEDFVGSSLGGRHVVQWAIHCPRAALDGGEQPHAHIMYSERRLDEIRRDPHQFFKRWNGKTPERGGCQKDGAGTEERLLATRKLWADIQNTHLELHGHEDRVDYRSLEAQGLRDELPEIHLGRHAYQLADSQREALREVRVARAEVHKAQAELDAAYLAARQEVMAQHEKAQQQTKAIEEERKRQQAVKTKVKRDEQERIMCEQRQQIADLTRQQEEIESRHHEVRVRRLDVLNKEHDDLRTEQLRDALCHRDDDDAAQALRDSVKQAAQLVSDAKTAIQLLERKAKEWKAEHPLRAFFGIGIGPLDEMRALAEAEIESQMAAEDELELAKKVQHENMQPIDARHNRRAEVRMRMTELQLQLKSIGAQAVGTVAEHQRLREIANEIEQLQVLQDECLKRNGGVCDDDDGAGSMGLWLTPTPEPRKKRRSVLVIEYVPVFVDEKLAKGYAIVESLKAITVSPLKRLASGLELTTDRIADRPDFRFARMRIFSDSVPANKEPEKFWRIEIDLSDVAQDEASILAHIEHKLETMRDELLPRPKPKPTRRKQYDDYQSPTPFEL